jgi:hypothetical protein
MATAFIALAENRARSTDSEPVAPVLRDILKARRLRDRHLPADLFADPAWDMLLDLMIAHETGKRVDISSLCIAACVPQTTGLRWIRDMTDRGILVRQQDTVDGRRAFIGLSDATASAMRDWAHDARLTSRDERIS